ncbi:MAG: CheR family methyltransferase, partial [Erythrobacter sp.]
LDTLARDAPMMTEVVAALTTNHTCFHREPHHFDHFASIVRPGLLQRTLAGEPVRIWSAGCSTGEEVWTLVMVLLGADRAAGLKLARSNLVALASDISVNALAGARAANYPAGALEALPEALRRIWCVPDSTTGEARLAIDPAAQAMVRFRELNLMSEWPMQRPFDVIFCRNVMIYFDVPTKELLIERFARQLLPGGYLYIGHSERVSGPATSLLEPVGPTIYQRRAR